MPAEVPIERLFEEELKRRHIPIVGVLEDGRYRIDLLGIAHTISLDNARKAYARDRNVSVIASFVDGLLASRLELPPWPDAAGGLRLSAESSDHNFQGSICTPVTDGLTRVLVFTDQKESLVSWLTPQQLARWGVSPEEAHGIASQNMAALLSGVTLQIEAVGDHKLGMVSTHSVFKASVIFSPALREFTAPLGWPVLAVVPARDFIYLFTSRELIPRLGRVVLREYTDSAYPVTSEVLEISDTGITALGAFGA